MKMVKSVIISVLLCLASTLVFGQTNPLLQKVDSLRYLKQEPFDCNSLYWRVIATGKEAIPFLIDKLDDTTQTQTTLTCKKRNVKLGDICYQALKEVFHIPLFYVTQQQFDVIDQNGCEERVFDYIDGNRKKFKFQVFSYYNKYKKGIKFIRYREMNKTDCRYKNKVLGYYDVAPLPRSVSSQIGTIGL